MIPAQTWKDLACYRDRQWRRTWSPSPFSSHAISSFIITRIQKEKSSKIWRVRDSDHSIHPRHHALLHGAYLFSSHSPVEPACNHQRHEEIWGFHYTRLHTGFIGIALWIICWQALKRYAKNPKEDLNNRWLETFHWTLVTSVQRSFPWFLELISLDFLSTDHGWNAFLF